MASEEPSQDPQRISDVKEPRQMSMVSKMYDLDGDGKLDEAELAMRLRDTSGRGYLTNTEVYELMKEHINCQTAMFETKRIMKFMVTLVIVLALSQLGTAVAAAYLAKETTTDANGHLTSMSTGEVLSTQSTATHDIDIQRATIDPETGRRRLNPCKRVGNGDGDDNGDMECETDSFLSMDWKTCNRMLKHCNRGNTVTVTRSWDNGESTDFNVCPYRGSIARFRVSRLRNNLGEYYDFEMIEGSHCRLDGEAVWVEEGGMCYLHADCGSGMECGKNVGEIKQCQSMCRRRRFAQRLVDECVEACDINTCNMLESNGNETAADEALVDTEDL